MIEMIGQVEGYYTLETFKADALGNEIPGSRRRPVPTFPNLITNGGLDAIGTQSDWLQYCQVGTGSTAPVVTDAALAARIASTNTTASLVSAATASPPYYASRSTTFRFAVGAAAGNISEVGVGWLSTSGLFSRALILDSGGSPTTITVLSDEILDVTYQFRVYPPTADVTGTITLAGVDHEYVGRAASVTNPSFWRAVSPAVLSVSPNPVAFNGAVGAITSSPAGTSSAATTRTDTAYSTGSHEKAGILTWGLAAGNLAGGISAIYYGHGSGAYQFGFTPPIPKINTQTLALTVKYSWARKTL